MGRQAVIWCWRSSPRLIVTILSHLLRPALRVHRTISALLVQCFDKNLSDTWCCLPRVPNSGAMGYAVLEIMPDSNEIMYNIGLFNCYGPIAGHIHAGNKSALALKLVVAACRPRWFSPPPRTPL